VSDRTPAEGGDRPTDGAADDSGTADADGEPPFLLTEHETPEGTLVAVCDAASLGETFAEDEVSLTVDEAFYGGDPADADAVADGLARASVANLVGRETVALAIDLGVVDPDNVLDVDGTRHAQVLAL
jgi:hypothetical protein